MGLFDLFSRNKAAEPVVQEIRSETVAGGITVASWDSAFGAGRAIDNLSVVYGCIKLRAQTVASLPLKLLQKTPNGHEPAIDNPYYNLITKAPNPRMTSFDFWYWAMVQLDTFGNVYIQKLSNSLGQVVELNPLNPINVLPEVKDDGHVYYRFTMANPQDPSSTWYKELRDDQIIHIKGYSRNSVFGLSPIHAFKDLFDQYSELQHAGTQIAKNSARPSSVITYPKNMKEEELNKFKAAWTVGLANGNSGKTAFVPDGVKVDKSPVGLTAQEAEYINQRQFTAQRIASDIFGVPLHMLGLNGGPTFASVEQMALEFVTYTINPILINIEQQLNRQLLDNDDEVYTKFAVKHLLRGDTATRIAFYQFALQNSVMTPNQVLRAEDDGIQISPIDGGDTYVRAVNYAKIDDSPEKPTAPVTGSAPSPTINIHNHIAPPNLGSGNPDNKTPPVSGSNSQ